MPNAELIHGSCLCRSVSWQAEKPLERMSHCHCSMCRKSHGAPFATYVAADARGFAWRGGEQHIVRYRSSEQVERCFCGRCGSAVPELFDGKAWMPAGCLDEDPGTRPYAHMFTASKAPWYEIPPDGLPRFEAYPPDFGFPVIERPREEASESGWVRGSCLCGDVAYELAAGAWTLMQCHCSRCRKGRAAAHGGNLFAEVSQLRWLHGTDQLRTYKVPEAERFAQTFCTRCGSAQPRAAGTTHYVVPASTLGADPGIESVRHIFVGSKASWFDIRDSWPQFETRPPDQKR
ncbi:MAG TPA: GFA family protein [Polyangiales bacterium]|nr:GFA family protein [Polyangiales bacterium]